MEPQRTVPYPPQVAPKTPRSAPLGSHSWHVNGPGNAWVAATQVPTGYQSPSTTTYVVCLWPGAGTENLVGLAPKGQNKSEFRCRATGAGRWPLWALETGAQAAPNCTKLPRASSK